MICAIIQARMGSSRLPEKVLADVEGKSMLARVVEQVKRSALVDQVMVATSVSHADDRIAAACCAMHLACFRGSEEDVLARYHGAARSAGADVIVRITADCPLMDPQIIDCVVGAFLEGSYDYAANTIERTYPDGLDVEVFSMQALDTAFQEARLKSEREHVTPFLWKRPEQFRLKHVSGDEDHSALRWTVDEAVDLEFVRRVYRQLAGRPVTMEAVLQIVMKDADLRSINAQFECNEGYQKSLREDRVLAPEEV